MKRIFFLGLTVVILIFTSCTKEKIVVEQNIVYTDNPPPVLFPPGTPYGNTYEVWIDSDLFNEKKNNGNLCNYDQMNGTWYDCGFWYSIPAKKYWGILNEKIYVSKSKDWHAVSPNAFVQLFDVIERKKTAIGSMCQNCPNPIGVNNMLTWFR